MQQFLSRFAVLGSVRLTLLICVAENSQSQICTWQRWDDRSVSVSDSSCDILHYICRAVLPDGQFSRTIGLFFSLHCGKFFAVAGCGFIWTSFIKVHAVFWTVFAKDFLSKSIVFVDFAEVVRFVLTWSNVIAVFLVRFCSLDVRSKQIKRRDHVIVSVWWHGQQYWSHSDFSFSAANWLTVYIFQI